MPSKLGFIYEILGRKDYDVVMGVSFGMLIFSSSRCECEKHYDNHKSNKPQSDVHSQPGYVD